MGAKQGENKSQDNQQESSPETFQDVQMLNRGTMFPGSELKQSSQQIVKTFSGCICFCPEVDTFFFFYLHNLGQVLQHLCISFLSSEDGDKKS